MSWVGELEDILTVVIFDQLVIFPALSWEVVRVKFWVVASVVNFRLLFVSKTALGPMWGAFYLELDSRGSPNTVSTRLEHYPNYTLP